MNKKKVKLLASLAVVLATTSMILSPQIVSAATNSEKPVIENKVTDKTVEKIDGKTAEKTIVEKTSGKTVEKTTEKKTNSINKKEKDISKEVNGQSVYDFMRISGKDRYETSFEIATKYKEMTQDKEINGAILALGEDFPDALSGSVLSTISKMPILLSGKTSDTSKKALDYVSKNLSKDKTIYILGGTGGIENSVIEKLKSMGFEKVERLGGKDRFETNKAIIEKLNPAVGMPVIIASGEDFPDALSASAIAGSQTFPILLVQRDSTPESVKELLGRIKPSKMFVIGGIGSVSEKHLDSLKNLTGLKGDNVVRLGGKDRYETSLEIAKHFNLGGDTVTFANGENFPDSLSGAALSALKNAPLLLLNNQDISKQKDYLASTKYTSEIFYGGKGVMPDSILDELTKR